MSDDLFFYVDGVDGLEGPLSDDAVRQRLREGRLDPDVRVRFAGGQVWAPARAWATLAVPRISVSSLEQPDRSVQTTISPDLLSATAEVLGMLIFVVWVEGKPAVALLGSDVRAGVQGGRYRSAAVSVLGTTDWIAARRLFDRTLSDGAVLPHSSPDFGTTRCAACAELTPLGAETCPECDEPLGIESPRTTRPGSIPDDPEGASWLSMHWRPLLTFGSIFLMIAAGITLRYWAPDRFESAQRASAATPSPAAACEAACWPGESCQLGTCVWQKPHDVTHLGATLDGKAKDDALPNVSGPFELPRDVTDVALIDENRFAVSGLEGVQVRSSKTGHLLELVSEAPQTRQLHRVGDAIYAVGPQHIAVLDGATMRLQKTLDMGGIIGPLTVAMGGRRVFVALPGAHAVAIVTTEFHAEIDRIRFGDDAIGPVAVDETGRRALTTTGTFPIAGLPDPQGGAVYAFDPSKLASAQDRVRASLLGNPVSVVMSPNGDYGYVALRGKNAIVPLEWLSSGTVRQNAIIPVCDQPEEIQIVKKSRRALVRCGRGRALEVIDLAKRELVRHIPMPSAVGDLVISPDGEQAIVTLPGITDGSVGLIDLETFEVKLLPLTAPPTRVRIAEDGTSAIILSDRVKSAWVLR